MFGLIQRIRLIRMTSRMCWLLKICTSLLLAGLLIGGVCGCSNTHTPDSGPPETVTGVTVIAAHRTKLPDSLEAVGTVRAAQSSQISSRVMGNLLEVRAHEGDRVQSGQVLAVIDDAQPRAAVDQATAAVAAAEKEVAAADSELALSESTQKRYQQLYEKQSLSPQEFDEVNSRRQSAEARRDMARAQLAQANAVLVQARTALGYTQVTAPFAGVVTEKMADAGALASPGMALFTLEKTGDYRLEVAVDESDVRAVHLGQTASVSLDALGNTPVSGKVAEIVPVADAASRSFLVKISLPANARVRSGLFGRARFARGERDALLIPHSSVVARGQLQAVYVIDANRIIGLRYITIGQSAGDQDEVLSGLQDGEKLVAIPGSRELAGKQIGSAP
jgi:RND family efflux transporter MFP subunit